MKFDIFPLPSIPGTLEDRETLRPIGRNNERYQQMLDELRKIAILADEIGIDALSTTEHHFHSEGFEASVAPLLLYADLAARTKRIKFAPLGLVLPSWDPIRCAEEIAVLDHLTKGRLIVGFARGYQDRWTNILGQHYHVTGAPMDGSEVDNHNRTVFEEVFKIIKMAWSQEIIDYNSEFYSIPQPYKEGIRRWPAAAWTRQYGAPGEVDDEGVIRRISVIPKPYQQPHPPLWQPFSVSESTIRWCAREDILPWILVSYPERFTAACRVYQEEATTVGRELRLGQGVGAARSISIGKTYEEAFALGAKTTGLGFYAYFAGFGFLEAFRDPGEDAPVPLTLPSPEAVYQRMVDHDYALCGTVDDIKRKMESISRCYTDGDLEWFGWSFPQGFLTWDEAQWQIETFGREILPEFKD